MSVCQYCQLSCHVHEFEKLQIASMPVMLLPSSASSIAQRDTAQVLLSIGRSFDSKLGTCASKEAAQTFENARGEKEKSPLSMGYVSGSLSKESGSDGSRLSFDSVGLTKPKCARENWFGTNDRDTPAPCSAIRGQSRPLHISLFLFLNLCSQFSSLFGQSLFR